MAWLCSPNEKKKAFCRCPISEFDVQWHCNHRTAFLAILVLFIKDSVDRVIVEDRCHCVGRDFTNRDRNHGETTEPGFVMAVFNGPLNDDSVAGFTFMIHRRWVDGSRHRLAMSFPQVGFKHV
ncbi:hypothetical protein NZK35_17505 [Stieleria sp. ICT_E10.1]|uniref:hypothetical protein n=1 Tax=Stieleria sedimenti TaxID=2976331 RepID=UPI00218024C6|nr:hypothetical protein [Stieleria sedimenti]MCS7468452.1 hypothetical protein [Stieleria sedimenti]